MDRTTIRAPHPAGAAEPTRAPLSRRTARDESASALVLVPTMMLVLLCLAGIAIDLTLLHGAHRTAHRAVTSAADDAAAMIDQGELQTTGRLVVDADAARRVALAELDTMTLPGRRLGAPDVVVDAERGTVTITLELAVDHVVLAAVPGHPGDERVRVVARGRLNR